MASTTNQSGASVARCPAVHRRVGERGFFAKAQLLAGLDAPEAGHEGVFAMSMPTTYLSGAAAEAADGINKRKKVETT